MKNIFVVILSRGWIGITRLPKALKDEGFNVITLSHKEHLLNESLFIDFKYIYSSKFEIRCKLLDITNKHKIDLMIPGCDFTVNYFCQIVQNRSWFQTSLVNLKDLIKQSWNNVGAYGLLGEKTSLQKIAVKDNIPNPRNMHFNSKIDVLEEVKNRKFPIVLKKDFGVAGLGVRICYSYDEVNQALKTVTFNFFVKNVIYKVKSLLKRTIALPYCYENFGISVQDYIVGTPCMHLVLASRGEVLSSITLLKVECQPQKTSPSSVVKAIRHSKISDDCVRIIKEMEVTGFLSFDFILDDNNIAFLLECNPRPTPVTHLSHLCGGNLCAMLKKHFMIDDGNLVPYPDIVYEYIALFPNELKRDPNSEYLTKAYHDVPFDDYKLWERHNEEFVKMGIKTDFKT